MPSGKKSWFARHCAPPPPINNTSACPCASCYNVGSGSHHGSSPYTYAYSYAPSTSSPMDSRAASLRSASSSDGASISSASTAATTTTHIEHVKQ
ncbi:hypothetical protein AK830_g7432 [Neonectria ditissima]|uniref:Uncharacterized protein n=1 Tax=Neonectria ditissima TaxID=78410 RepID=A0A0P7BG86_9HYPO|nr:hypothetical protein AK830_g7432 [Neonectria ditissima]